MNENTNAGDEFVRLLSEYTAQLEHESERGTVIVSAALMDEALEDLIKAKLVPSPEKEDELFVGAYATLGNFSAKIDFAYRLGLIGLSTRNSLHLIRKLRNDFAHSSLKESFESNRVKSRVRELFKLNKDLLDFIWAVAKKRDHPKVNKFSGDIESRQSIDCLVAIASWRVIFEILVSVVALSLKLRNKEIDPLTSWTERSRKTDT